MGICHNEALSIIRCYFMLILSNTTATSAPRLQTAQLVFGCLLFLFASGLITGPASAEQLTLERIFASPALSGPTLRQVELSPAGDRVTFLRGRDEDRSLLDLWEYDLEEGVTRRLIAADELLTEDVALSAEEQARRERARISDLRGIVEYRWSQDGSQLLFPLGGNLFHASLPQTADAPVEIRQLTASDSFDLDPKIAPDHRHAAFIRDQNLWIVNIESAQSQALTNDGGGTLKNGMAEFIAQEEMGRSTGYWWSPDGQMIAFLQVDESPIEPSTRFEVSGDRIDMIEQRYPYAGTPNVRYRLGLVRIEEPGAIEYIDVLDQSQNQDIYIPRVQWLPDSSGLTFQRQSRNQQRLELVLHSIDGSAQRVLVQETSDTWINLHDDLNFLSEKEALIWSSEQSGYRHIYLIDLDGNPIRSLTTGQWPVDAVVGVDEELGFVYFTAFKEGPTEQHLYRQSLATESPGDVTKVSRRSGWHEISMDSAARHYLDQFSSTDQPPQLSLHSADGERIAWLIENQVNTDHPYAPFLDDHQPTEFGIIQSDDGMDLHYRMVKPANFSQQRQYPVFLHVYGGPTSRVVLNRWGRRHLVDQFMAQSGYLVFSIDNRGIVGQGMKFQEPAYKKLGIVEVADQMAGVEFLRNLPFVDQNRIGVFGWSYGGYMALMMQMQHPGSFAAGVAVAPVTDWALYDTHYTERYLGMPRDEQGLPTEAYRLGNVLTYASQLSDPMLLIHGMADDNVLFTHSTMLMQQLQDQAIPFELMTYPGEKHGISGTGQRLHVYRHWVDFFNRTLEPESIQLIE